MRRSSLNDLNDDFAAWLDGALAVPIPPNTVAFAFNLYESVAGTHIQLVGCSKFSEDKQDWPCAETFSSGENVFELSAEIGGETWREALETVRELISWYLRSGSKALLLSSSKGVGVGFVDGDIMLCPVAMPPNNALDTDAPVPSRPLQLSGKGRAGPRRAGQRKR